METGLTAGGARGEAGARERICRTHDRGHAVLAAAGSECERTCGAPGRGEAWCDRVVVVRSPIHAPHQAAGLETRLSHAEAQLTALTPPRGRGNRPSTDAATLVGAMDGVRTEHRGEGLRRVPWEQQVEPTTPYVGRGRGAGHRAKRGIQKIRYPLTHLARQADSSAAHRHRLGWKACGTHAGHTRLSLQEAVWCERHAYRVARIFHRLKSRLHIAPLFGKRNEPIEGLTSLLTLGVRVLPVMECVLRRSLGQDQARLPNMPPENKPKSTDRPTAERLLQAFAGVSLTSIAHATGEERLRRITPLSGVQEAILPRLGVGTTLYRQLEIQNMGS